MIATTLSDEQRTAVDAPFDRLVTIVGAPGTGKSTALAARIERFAAEHPRTDFFDGRSSDAIADLAFDILRRAGTTIRIVDDVDAAITFEQSAQALFALEWTEFLDGSLDPEVPGLRSPERFLDSAFRLIRKLRDAAISPAEFLSRSLSGATSFYAKPPNFAHPDLLYATKDAYRDSLDVSPAELQRQYRREVDLAKILARLYEHYTTTTAQSRRMTPRDAIVTAAEQLRSSPALLGEVQDLYPYAFIDEAEELTLGELGLLQAIYGESLANVTLAGDPNSAIGTFRGARPDRVFQLASERVELHEQQRSPVALEIACAQLTANPKPPDKRDAEPALRIFRAQSQREEASYIAEYVAGAIAGGAEPATIAVLFRSTADVATYADALLRRDIPAIVSGDVNLFADRRALDALALLWNVWDPFRHDWLLRTLAGPALALSDSSVATLCAEPANPQTPLFVFDDEPSPTARAGRWDPKRDLRLGWNVIRGEQDAALTSTARERVERFRALREGWIEALQTRSFDAFVRLVWSEGLARHGAAGSAPALAQQAILARLRDRLVAFFEGHPQANLGDALRYAEERAASDLETCEDFGDPRFVRLMSIDAARGSTFEHIVIPDARAGSFPRWYAPDTFLFSPALGMIPKENVGDAKAARTAKFSYYLYRAKTRDNYNAEERRAFVYALRRASKSALVTASERATRGTAAPEFLEELRSVCD